MKKYLSDLEKELKKLKISDEEIQEILADHKEMLAEAKNDGISDDELKEKFGNPQQVAAQLKRDAIDRFNTDGAEPVVGEGELEGYELFKTFPVIGGLEKVAIDLISEDLLYLPYEGEHIQLFARKLKHPEDYEVSFDKGVFVLKRKKKVGLSFMGRKSTPDFGVKVPVGLSLEEFTVKCISGDFKVDNVESKVVKFKSTSGDFEVSNISGGTVALHTISGDFECQGIKCDSMDISLISGDCELEMVEINGDLNANTVSGDMEVKDMKVENIVYRSVSGDFEGEEVYPDSISLRSVSGDFDIRNSIHDQTIEIVSKKTVSGDVTIN